MSSGRGAISGLMFLLFIQGCVYSPPIRGTHYGAPGRLKAGRLELSGASGMVISDGTNAVDEPRLFYGGPGLALALNDWLQLEAGGELSQLGGSFKGKDVKVKENFWAQGYLGARFTARWAGRYASSAADLELGFGLGAGGRDASEENEPGWDEHFTFGAYAGAGVGIDVSWFSVFVRARLQESKAYAVPATLWGSGVLGLQARMFDKVSLHAAIGLAGYRNSDEWAHGGIFEIGLAIDMQILDVPDRSSP
ncbi:MAG: hypothetical protein JXR96_19550 [Deltaproteobacteria bacterium]|nr:hypothetical protein [Deltaproteobacteria bacterium]